MKKFVLAITYEPKIAAVLHGSRDPAIRQRGGALAVQRGGSCDKYLYPEHQ